MVLWQERMPGCWGHTEAPLSAQALCDGRSSSTVRVWLEELGSALLPVVSAPRCCPVG